MESARAEGKVTRAEGGHVDTRGWRPATVSWEELHLRGNLARRWKDETASGKGSTQASPRPRENTAELYPRGNQTRRQEDVGASGLENTQKSPRYLQEPLYGNEMTR